jgi:hypothetical protein
MASRKNLYHHEEVRRKIQTSQLLNRLTAHANGEIELSATQIRAIEILIKKVLPDLSSVTHSGDDDNPIEHRVLVTGVMRPVDREPQPELITVDVTPEISDT